MKMDMLRSCYKTSCRFYPDLDLETEITWYFAADDAQDFPTWHRFGSGNWATTREAWPGIGEVSGAPRPWINGANWLGYQGQKFCGRKLDYQEGCGWESIWPANVPDGRSYCCAPFPLTCDVVGYFFNSSTPITIIGVKGTSPGGPIGRVGMRFDETNLPWTLTRPDGFYVVTFYNDCNLIWGWNSLALIGQQDAFGVTWWNPFKWELVSAFPFKWRVLDCPLPSLVYFGTESTERWDLEFG